MSFEKIREAKTESERVNEIYHVFDEDSRLNRTPAARIEFMTTVHYIERYLPAGGKLCDIGAGAGEYSLYFSAKGCDVVSVELSDANVKAFRKKIKPEDSIQLIQANALDLSMLESQQFDVVLLMGPLYHLEQEQDKLRAIEEAKRLCKPQGKIVISFIANDMVMFTELLYNPDHFIGDSYNHDTFIVENFPFVFHTIDKMNDVLKKAGIEIDHAIAVDGMSELLETSINQLDDEGYQQYYKFHLKTCEDPCAIARSNHVTYIGR